MWHLSFAVDHFILGEILCLNRPNLIFLKQKGHSKKVEKILLYTENVVFKAYRYKLLTL